MNIETVLGGAYALPAGWVLAFANEAPDLAGNNILLLGLIQKTEPEPPDVATPSDTGTQVMADDVLTPSPPPAPPVVVAPLPDPPPLPPVVATVTEPGDILLTAREFG